MTRQQVEVGQHYRIARTDYGGSPSEWRVIGVYTPWPGGVEHARLESLDGRGETMTLATSVVADKARFVAIQ